MSFEENKIEALSRYVVYRNCSQSGFAEAKEIKLKVRDKKKIIEGKDPRHWALGNRKGWKSPKKLVKK